VVLVLVAGGTLKAMKRTPDQHQPPTPEPIHSVEDLEVFQLAHRLVLGVYQATGSFPRRELFALVSQLRRAAASIPANLAEGGGRLHRSEYRHFVGIAKGSAAEVGYHLLLARDLGYLQADLYQELRRLTDQIGRMLTRLAQALE
jgi:four helix bundle protein